MTDPLHKQYTQLKANITKNIHLLNRHDQIRARHWLQKLQVPISNNVWKQNRNLYLKVLQEMVSQGELAKPFNQSPPQGSLPKLSVYEVPYPIRIRLGVNQPRTQGRSVSNNRSVCNSRKNSLASLTQNSRSVSGNVKNMDHRKKIEFNSKLEINADRNKQNRSHFRFNQEKISVNDSYLVSREVSKQKNKTQKIQSTYKYEDNDIKKKGCELLRKILMFLGQHYQQFQDSIVYSQLIEKIVLAGDQFGQDFRQITICNKQQSLQIEKYNKRIKSKLFQTDLNNIEFMNYLNSL